jgi:hypothetical protein
MTTVHVNKQVMSWCLETEKKCATCCGRPASCLLLSACRPLDAAVGVELELARSLLLGCCLVCRLTRLAWAARAVLLGSPGWSVSAPRGPGVAPPRVQRACASRTRWSRSGRCRWPCRVRAPARRRPPAHHASAARGSLPCSPGQPRMLGVL